VNHTVLSLRELTQEGGSLRNHSIPDLDVSNQRRGSFY